MNVVTDRRQLFGDLGYGGPAACSPTTLPVLHIMITHKGIVIDGEDFYLDLLFYHRRLRRLVALGF